MNGHPVHPALVHFPIACWSLASMGDLASLWFPEVVAGSSAALHVAGTTTALGVMLSGLVDSARVKPGSPAVRTLGFHMGFVMLAWCAYALSLWSRWAAAGFPVPGTFALLMSLAGFVSLGLAGWFGGQLVYVHGVGVMAVKNRGAGN